MLDGRGSGDEVEGRSVGGGEDTVFGDGSEILGQGMEAVDGKVGGGTLGGSFAARIGRGASGGNGRGSVRRVGMAEVVIEEHGGESLSHMELDVIGEHAEEDVGTDARGQVVIDGADLEVYGFVAAEGAFDLAEAFVDADGLFWAEGMGGHIGADDIEAVDKIPRKGGPGITRSDLLIINKIDLSPLVGASLEVMDRDARKMRGDRPFVFSNLRQKTGLQEVIQFIVDTGGL